VHAKKAGDTAASKSVVLFYPKPSRCYTNTATFDGVDLSDIDIGNGESVAVVQEAKYLGCYATRAGTDPRDVEERISTASQAFGALKHYLFRRRDVATEVKRSVYCGLILAIRLLFGAAPVVQYLPLRRALTNNVRIRCTWRCQAHLEMPGAPGDYQVHLEIPRCTWHPLI
jgi:hypothetical protein